MFFVGIFGVQSKVESLKTEVGTPCPVCGAFDRYDIKKAYTYFHFFFLPLWKWNKRYYVQTRCCQRVCSLDESIGSRIEAGEPVEIPREHITCDQSHDVPSLCSRCREPVEPSHRFCPHCGVEL